MAALDTQRFLSGKEVAELLGLHPNTIWKWAAQDRIPSIKVGGSRKYLLRDVIAALEEGGS